MPTPPPRPLFSVHIMKTGGMTLRSHIERAVGRAHLYPSPQSGTAGLGAKASMEQLRSAVVAGGDRFRAFHVHQPYVAHRLVGREVTTLTVLRDPTERAVSALRQMSRRLRRSPEEIYERPWLRERLFVGHQVRVLGLGADEAGDWADVHRALLFADRWFDDPDPPLPPPVAMDDAHLAAARRNLAAMDLVGVLERFDDLLDLLAAELGWSVARTAAVNVGSGRDVAADLRARIAEDNAAEQLLYEDACRLVAERLP